MTEPPRQEFDEHAVRVGKRILRGAAATGGLLTLLLLYWLAPGFTAGLLYTFAVVVLAWTIAGIVKPSWTRIENRLASVWLFTFAIGLFFAGGVALDRSERVARDREAASATEAAAEARAAEAAETRRAATREAAERRPDSAAMVMTSRNSAAVTLDTWTDGPWPFTLDAGVIGCVPTGAGPVLVFTDTDGAVWPLNGIAAAHAPTVGGRTSIDPIWRQDATVPGLRVNLGPMIQAAGSLC